MPTLQESSKTVIRWATLSEEEKEPYVVEARGERDAFEARRQQQLYGDDEPWEADRPRRPATVFDLWSRAAKPREKMPAGTTRSPNQPSRCGFVGRGAGS